MTDLDDCRHEPRLRLDRLEILELLAVPMRGDRMVLLRSIEEALGDLAVNAAPDAQAYLLMARPALPDGGQPGRISSAEKAERGPDGRESVYLAEGRLNLPYLTRSAELLVRNGEFRLARQVYLAIARSGERTGVALLGIARCLEAEGRLDEARARYEESIAYLPNPETYQRLATVLVAMGKDLQAAGVIERALRAADLSRDIRFELCRTAGGCLGRAGKLAEAGSFYIKALEIRPDSDEIHCSMGTIHLGEGRLELARAGFERALELNPVRHEALTGLGICALAAGDPQEAGTWLARALKVEIRNPAAIFHIVKCAYELKNHAIAEPLVEEYLDSTGPDLHLLYSLAGLQYHLKKIDKALATCRKILELDPRHSGAIDLVRRLGTPEIIM